jgi:hypothetical protein
MILTLLCTHKVAKTYDLTALPRSSESAERPDFLHWYCNLIRLRRRRCLLFTHEQSLFSFVIYQFSKRDVANLLDLFRTHLGQAMRAESMSEDAIEALMSRIDGIEFGPTQSRSVLGSMNDIMFQFRFDVEEYFGFYEVSPVLLSEVTHRTNGMPMGAMGYARPDEEFPRLLQAFLVKGVS